MWFWCRFHEVFRVFATPAGYFFEIRNDFFSATGVGPSVAGLGSSMDQGWEECRIAFDRTGFSMVSYFNNYISETLLDEGVKLGAFPCLCLEDHMCRCLGENGRHLVPAMPWQGKCSAKRRPHSTGLGSVLVFPTSGGHAGVHTWKGTRLLVCLEYTAILNEVCHFAPICATP